MSTNTKHDQTVLNILNEIKSQKPTAKEDDAMQSRLAVLIEQYDGPVAEEEHINTKNGGFWPTIKRLFNPLQLGMVGTATAFVLTLSFVLTSTVATPVYANVINNLNVITSMIYSGKMESNGEGIMNIDVFYQAPSKIRVVSQPLPSVHNTPSVINVMDTELGKGLIIFPARQVAMPLDFPPGKNAKDALENKLFDWHTHILNYEGEVITEPGGMINSIETTAFIIKPEQMTITLWVDPKTELPVRIRVESATQANFIFEADVSFNQQLDPSLFDLNPSDFAILGTDAD